MAEASNVTHNSPNILCIPMGVDDYVQLILTSTAELPGKLNKIFIDTLMKANI